MNTQWPDWKTRFFVPTSKFAAKKTLSNSPLFGQRAVSADVFEPQTNRFSQHSPRPSQADEVRFAGKDKRTKAQRLAVLGAVGAAELMRSAGLVGAQTPPPAPTTTSVLSTSTESSSDVSIDPLLEQADTATTPQTTIIPAFQLTSASRAGIRGATLSEPLPKGYSAETVLPQLRPALSAPLQDLLLQLAQQTPLNFSTERSGFSETDMKVLDQFLKRLQQVQGVSINDAQIEQAKIQAVLLFQDTKQENSSVLADAQEAYKALNPADPGQFQDLSGKPQSVKRYIATLLYESLTMKVPQLVEQLQASGGQIVLEQKEGYADLDLATLALNPTRANIMGTQSFAMWLACLNGSPVEQMGSCEPLPNRPEGQSGWWLKPFLNSDELNQAIKTVYPLTHFVKYDAKADVFTLTNPQLLGKDTITYERGVAVVKRDPLQDARIMVSMVLSPQASEQDVDTFINYLKTSQRGAEQLLTEGGALPLSNKLLDPEQLNALVFKAQGKNLSLVVPLTVTSLEDLVKKVQGWTQNDPVVTLRVIRNLINDYHHQDRLQLGYPIPSLDDLRATGQGRPLVVPVNLVYALKASDEPPNFAAQRGSKDPSSVPPLSDRTYATLANLLQLSDPATLQPPGDDRALGDILNSSDSGSALSTGGTSSGNRHSSSTAAAVSQQVSQSGRLSDRIDGAASSTTQAPPATTTTQAPVPIQQTAPAPSPASLELSLDQLQAMDFESRMQMMQQAAQLDGGFYLPVFPGGAVVGPWGHFGSSRGSDDHMGVDFYGPADAAGNDTQPDGSKPIFPLPVFAPESGEVVEVGHGNYSGWYIKFRGDSGKYYNLIHMADFSQDGYSPDQIPEAYQRLLKFDGADGVQVGERFQAGQSIGFVGKTGTGWYHLHFEVKSRESGGQINPLSVEQGSPEPLVKGILSRIYVYPSTEANVNNQENVQHWAAQLGITLLDAPRTQVSLPSPTSTLSANNDVDVATDSAPENTQGGQAATASPTPPGASAEAPGMVNPQAENTPVTWSQMLRFDGQNVYFVNPRPVPAGESRDYWLRLAAESLLSSSSEQPTANDVGILVEEILKANHIPKNSELPPQLKLPSEIFSSERLNTILKSNPGAFRLAFYVQAASKEDLVTKLNNITRSPELTQKFIQAYVDEYQRRDELYTSARYPHLSPQKLEALKQTLPGLEGFPSYFPFPLDFITSVPPADNSAAADLVALIPAPTNPPAASSAEGEAAHDHGHDHDHTNLSASTARQGTDRGVQGATDRPVSFSRAFDSRRGTQGPVMVQPATPEQPLRIIKENARQNDRLEISPQRLAELGVPVNELNLDFNTPDGRINVFALRLMTQRGVPYAQYKNLLDQVRAQHQQGVGTDRAIEAFAYAVQLGGTNLADLPPVKTPEEHAALTRQVFLALTGRDIEQDKFTFWQRLATSQLQTVNRRTGENFGAYDVFYNFFDPKQPRKVFWNDQVGGFKQEGKEFPADVIQRKAPPQPTADPQTLQSIAEVDQTIATLQAQRQQVEAELNALPQVESTTAPGYLVSPFEGQGYQITSHFSPARVHPITGQVRPHKGIDLVPAGSSYTVTSAQDGVVDQVAFEAKGYGHYLYIDHGVNAEGVRMYTGYAHLDGPPSVQPGQPVKAGQPIGIMGNTGGSTGAHLHFEVWQDNTAVEPLPYLNGEKPLTMTQTGDPAMAQLRQDKTAVIAQIDAQLGTLNQRRQELQAQAEAERLAAEQAAVQAAQQAKLVVGSRVLSATIGSAPRNEMTPDDSYITPYTGSLDDLTQMNNPIVVAIGVAEGTRYADGNVTKHWGGHTDPGDSNRNIGTFSNSPSRNNGLSSSATPQEAEQYQAQLLLRYKERVKQAIAAVGVQENTREFAILYFAAMDLLTQASPDTTLESGGLLERFVYMVQDPQGFTPEFIATQRADSFQGGQNKRAFPTYDSLYNDQKRRMDAIFSVLGSMVV